MLSTVFYCYFDPYLLYNSDIQADLYSIYFLLLLGNILLLFLNYRILEHPNDVCVNVLFLHIYPILFNFSITSLELITISIIGFAANLLTDLLPTCSIDIAKFPRTSANSFLFFESYFSD